MPIGSQRRGERGQTILLVAVSIVSLLAMAALAIDVVSLYVARSEVQRAADAAALAGAQAIANSGMTTLSLSDANITAAETLATSMANASIQAVLANNLVAASAPTCTNCPLTSGAGIDYSRQGNPIVTVTLQQTNLPTFFSKIWGSRLISTSATSVAEAYNPSNPPSPYTYTPIAPRCVKPWLVPNADPGSGLQFVTPATGAIPAPVLGLIGETFTLRADCNGTGPTNCVTWHNPPLSGGGVLEYAPANVSAHTVPPNMVPSSCDLGPDALYTEAIEACDMNVYSCGGPLNTTSCTTPFTCWDPSVNPTHLAANGDAVEGTECLIDTAAGQDTLSWPNPFPNGPPEIIAGNGPQFGKAVTTSSSVVTIPIADLSNYGGDWPTTPPDAVQVVGFLQAFVQSVDTASPYGIHVTIMNVAGCGANPTAGVNPITGGFGNSPVPVRLITPP